MSWPAHIVRKSNRLSDTETIENKFYPLYDDILNECFPRDQFNICPHYATPLAQLGSESAIDHTIAYVIEALNIDSIVLIIEIKLPAHLHSSTARKNADNQMHDRFREVENLVRIPTLHAISVIGRQLCYYSYDKATGFVQPTRIVDADRQDRDTAPLTRWDSNIMEPTGRAKFLSIMKVIQTMIKALWYVYFFPHSLIT